MSECNYKALNLWRLIPCIVGLPLKWQWRTLDLCCSMCLGLGYALWTNAFGIVVDLLLLLLPSGSLCVWPLSSEC